MKELSIHSVRTYESVSFENKLRTHFVTKGTPHTGKVDITVIEAVGVELKSEKDHVIVPFANIRGIYLNTEEKTKKIKEREEDLKAPAKAQKVNKPKVDPKGAKR